MGKEGVMMTNLRKKALWMSLLGFVLGIVVGLCFLLIPEPESLSFTNQILTMVLYYVFCGLLGAISMGTSVIYDIESWSILRCTVTHFLITIVGFIIFYAGLIVIGISSLPPPGICFFFIVIFVVIYFCIWLIQYLVFRHKVKKMNAKLQTWKAHKKQPNTTK